VTRAALLLALAALAGCAATAPTAGGARAIEIYRAGRARSGALALAARDGSAAAAPASLRLEDALALARRSSARLVEAEARVAAASAGVGEAEQLQNPELQVNQLRADQIAAGEPRVKPLVRFKPNRPGEIDAKVAAARAGEAAARAELRAAEIDLEEGVRWAFDDLLLLDAEIAAASRFAKEWQKTSARVKDRLDQSVGTAVDDATAELFSIHADLIASELVDRRATALAALLDRLGLDPGADVRVEGQPALAWPPPKLPPEPALVEAALAASPDVAASAARIDGADAKLRLEKGRRWPWLTFVDLGYELGPGNPAGQAWTVQAGMELPLFHTNGGAARAAEAGLVAERRGLVARTESIAREVRARRREVEAAEALVDAFRKRALPAFDRTATEAERALDSGAIDVLKLLQVKERREFVELRFLGLVRRYRTAVAGLRRAVGGPLPGG
jgi:outer membrane protein TolC